MAVAGLVCCLGIMWGLGLVNPGRNRGFPPSLLVCRTNLTEYDWLCTEMHMNGRRGQPEGCCWALLMFGHVVRVWLSAEDKE